MFRGLDVARRFIDSGARSNLLELSGLEPAAFYPRTQIAYRSPAGAEPGYAVMKPICPSGGKRLT